MPNVMLVSIGNLSTLLGDFCNFVTAALGLSVEWGYAPWVVLFQVILMFAPVRLWMRSVPIFLAAVVSFVSMYWINSLFFLYAFVISLGVLVELMAGWCVGIVLNFVVKKLVQRINH